MKQFELAQVAGLFLVFAASAAHAGIFQWEYINPADPNQGKQQSTTLAPDGAGVDAVPGANLAGRNLTMAYLIGADLTGAYFYAKLTNADMSQANLSGASFWSANFTGAEIRGAGFDRIATWRNCCSPRYWLVGSGIAPAQLYSTASYQAHDLSGISVSQNDLAGANFTGQNLTDANFSVAELT